MPNEPAENIKGRDGETIECQTRGQSYGSNCPVCGARVIIHCPGCSRQITGCTCTVQARVKGEDLEDVEREIKKDLGKS